MKKSILALLFVVISMVSCNNREKERYYLPEGFIGEVYILFENNEGIDAKYKEGYRVYEIPSSGVLKTKFTPNYGQLSKEFSQYFYVNDDGRLTRIPEKENKLVDGKLVPIIDSTIVQIYGKTVGSVGEKIYFERFIVDKYTNRKNYGKIRPPKVGD